jgi:hypothetical protein
MPDPTALIVASVSFVTALGTLYQLRTKARVDELIALRDRVDELTTENGRLHKENIRLREFISVLVIKLNRAGIEMPTMPALFWDPDQEIWTKEPKEGE